MEGLGTPPTSVVALTRSKSEATRSKGFLHACSSVTGFGLTKTRDIGALSAPKRAGDVKGDSMAEPSSPARRMRKVLAKQSNARRASEVAELKRAAAEQARRNKTTATRTDDDIMDEEAGKARILLAAQSKARFEKEALALANANASARARRNKVGTRTDDDIDDEEAGRMRKTLAAASERRRQEEAQALTEKQREMRRRLAAVHAVDPSLMSHEVRWARSLRRWDEVQRPERERLAREAEEKAQAWAAEQARLAAEEQARLEELERMRREEDEKRERRRVQEAFEKAEADRIAQQKALEKAEKFRLRMMRAKEEDARMRGAREVVRLKAQERARVGATLMSKLPGGKIAA